MPKKGFIPALTGLRAICAYGIFFYHLNVFSQVSQPELHRFMGQFYSFIPFFFVISGFVIFFNYYKEEGYTKNELYNYFVSRFARIFPLLILLNACIFFLSYRENIYTAAQSVKLFFLNISLSKGFSSVYLLTGVGPSWTNSVEEIFYLIAPLIFLLHRKKYFLVKMVLLFYSLGISISFIMSRVDFEGFFSDYAFTFYFTFFGRAFEFAAGIYLAQLYMGLKTNRLLSAIGRSTVYIGPLLIGLCFLAQYFIARYYGVAHANEVWPGIFVNNICFPVAIFLFLYSLLYHKSLLQRFFSIPMIVKLGNATYSFYLLHTTFVLSYIYKFISKNIFITLIIMILIAYLVYKTIEQPLAKLIRKKLSRPVPVQPNLEK